MLPSMAVHSLPWAASILACRRYKPGQKFGKHIDESVELPGGRFTGRKFRAGCWSAALRCAHVQAPGQGRWALG